MADTVQTWSPELQGISQPSSAKGGLRLLCGGARRPPLLMCLPLIVIIAGLVVYPACYSIYLSMLNKAQTRLSGSAISASSSRATFSGWWRGSPRFSLRRGLLQSPDRPDPRTSSTICPARVSVSGAACFWCRRSFRWRCLRWAGGGCSIPPTPPSTGSSAVLDTTKFLG